MVLGWFKHITFIMHLFLFLLYQLHLRSSGIRSWRSGPVVYSTLQWPCSKFSTALLILSHFSFFFFFKTWFKLRSVQLALLAFHINVSSWDNRSSQAFTRKLRKQMHPKHYHKSQQLQGEGSFLGLEAVFPRDYRPTKLPHAHTYCQSFLEFPLIAKRQKTHIICLRSKPVHI